MNSIRLKSSLVLVTPPAVEPVTLADMKSQLGISPYEDRDHLVEEMRAKRLRRLITVSRQECENITRRCFITQTWKWSLDGWPCGDGRYEMSGYQSLVLPKPPFQSVQTFTYTDALGNAQDMTVYGFQADPGGETQPARLTAPYQQPWPVLKRVPNNVQITFKCGYGDTGAAVPAVIPQAILFLAQFYEENGAVTDLPVPRVVQNLLGPYIHYVS